MQGPLISVCIPAYRRVAYLERLLESLTAQTFKDFEVVLTDDSPDDSVQLLTAAFAGKLPLRYHKNPVQLGTPENWNEGIRQARGAWIKIMHDDDWFTGAEALERFATASRNNPGTDFIFSAYQNVYEDSGKIEPVRLSAAGWKRLTKTPWNLLGANYIGNPSCTLFRKDQTLFFDKRFKWVVDFEFYIRYLKAHKAWKYLDEPLVNVGINPTQVTTYTFGKPEVQVPENHLLLSGNGAENLENLVVYDYFWRLYRNLKIKSLEAVENAGYTEPLPRALQSMIRWQQKIPRALLKTGPISKALMFVHYLTHPNRI